MKWMAAAAAAFLLGTGAAAILTGGPNPEATPTTAEVAQRIMSPFCPGLTLEECPSGQSAQLRNRIDQQVSAGQTNRQIDNWLVAEYGEAVLASPRSSTAWAVPAAVAFAGTAGLAYGLSRRGRRSIDSGAEDQPIQAAIKPTDRTRLNEELRRFAEGTE